MKDIPQRLIEVAINFVDVVNDKGFSGTAGETAFKALEDMAKAYLKEEKGQTYDHELGDVVVYRRMRPTGTWGYNQFAVLVPDMKIGVTYTESQTTKLWKENKITPDTYEACTEEIHSEIGRQYHRSNMLELLTLTGKTQEEVFGRLNWTYKYYRNRTEAESVITDVDIEDFEKSLGLTDDFQIADVFNVDLANVVDKEVVEKIKKVKARYYTDGGVGKVKRSARRTK